MNNLKTITVAVAIALATSGGMALAQSSGPVKPQYEILTGARAAEDGPRGIQMGEGLYVFPYAKLGIGRDDNLFLRPTNEKSSNLTIFNPGFQLQARRQNALYKLAVDAVNGDYSDSSADNYLDRTFRGSGEWVFSNSAGLLLGLNSDYLHDARGSTDRPFGNEPDTYRDNGANVLFAYGANDAKGRIELAAGTAQKRYLDNRSYTVAADRDTDNLRGTAFFRVMPRTSVLFEASQFKYDYTLSSSTLDSKENRYMVGVTWEATALTSGTVKVGNLKKDFSSSVRNDFSGSNWEAAVQWSPMTYSRFDFYTLKTIYDTTGIGDFVLSKRSGVAWKHDWNSKLSSIVNYNYIQDDFLGAGSSRKDDINALGFKVNYKLSRVFTLGADYTYTDRDSNIPDFRFKRNQFMFTAGAAL
jgi:polysaccharide biosynthesis protein VpsM